MVNSSKLSEILEEHYDDMAELELAHIEAIVESRRLQRADSDNHKEEIEALLKSFEARIDRKLRIASEASSKNSSGLGFGSVLLGAIAGGIAGAALSRVASNPKQFTANKPKRIDAYMDDDGDFLMDYPKQQDLDDMSFGNTISIFVRKRNGERAEIKLTLVAPDGIAELRIEGIERGHRVSPKFANVARLLRKAAKTDRIIGV